MSTGDERLAARVGLYRLLTPIFEYPSAELYDALKSGEYQAALKSVCASLQIRHDELPPIACGREELEAEYLATFELGRDGEPACVLQEGNHVSFERDDQDTETSAGRPALLEDLLRFYHYFGLRLTSDPEERRPPDHLACQLEMLSRLGDLEWNAADRGAVSEGYRRAQHDFLARHLLPWLPAITKTLSGTSGASEARRLYAAAANATLAGVTAHADECLAAGN